MALEDFHFIQRFIVPFDHVDMMQHVNNVAYFIWLQTARCDYLQEVLGVGISGPDSIIVARHELSYEAPLDYHEPVAVGCRISRLGRKSFEMVYEVWSESRKQRSAVGNSTLVAYNYDRKESIGIPEAWRSAIRTYERVKPAE